MAFEIDESAAMPIAKDKARGVQIGHGHERCIRWDQSHTFPFYYSDKFIEFIFAGGLPPKKVTVNGKPHSVPSAAYIIEDDFKKSLERERRIAGKPPITDMEYRAYRSLVSEGVHTLITGGKRDDFMSDFRVHFISDIKAWRKKFKEISPNIKV